MVSESPTEKKLEERWAQCARCGGKRRCRVHGHFLQTSDDEHYDWSEHWRIMQCCGCDYTFVQTIYADEYNTTQDQDGEEVRVEGITYWPALAKRSRPEWMGIFGIDTSHANMERLEAILTELYTALDNDILILAGIGIRTAFDVAAELLGIAESKTFKQKLNDLVARSHIGPADRTRIETLVDAGSASAHRAWKPSVPDLNAMTDILEHFIYEAFVASHRKKLLDDKAAKVKAGVPARKKAKELPKPS